MIKLSPKLNNILVKRLWLSKWTLIYCYCTECNSARRQSSERLTQFYCFYSVEGEGGQHGQGLPAQETLAAAADLRGHGRAAGSQRRHLQRGEDQQRLQQGKDHVCRQQGAEREQPDVSIRDVNDSSIID